MLYYYVVVLYHAILYHFPRRPGDGAGAAAAGEKARAHGSVLQRI